MIVATPAPTPDARAEEIFARTRVAFAARTFPSTIKYSVRISGYKDGKWTGRSYQTYEDWPASTIFARSISDEEAANPIDPGQGICFFGIGSPKRSGLELPGLLGFPQLAVTYAFGLAQRGVDAAAPATGGSGLRNLGTVHAVARKYIVTLVGEEPVDGDPCWHLALQPVGNPGKYRVRDLWVEESSYETVKLVTDGNFTGKETGSGRWTVTYVQSGESWYLQSESSNVPVDEGTGRFDRVAVQFMDVQADPHENLDFGLAGSSKDAELEEPPEEDLRS